MDLNVRKLELSGFKRLLTKQVKYLCYDVTTDLQVIIGGNGYGKSSVFYEISPLPAASKDYIKGGFKKITIDANGKNYQLNSIFNNGNHHEFICDGVELNTGHTINVQKQLVEMHFKYTSWIHEILVGRRKFVDLPMAQRKEWLAILSPATVDYAIDLHKHYSVELRNIVGAEQNIKAKIVEVTKEIIDEEDLTELEETIASLKPLIVKLVEARPKVEPLTDKQRQQLSSTALLASTQKEFMATYGSAIQALSGDSADVQENDLRAQLSEERDMLVEYKTARASWIEEYQTIEETIAELDFSDGRSLEDIQKEINTASLQLATLPQIPDWILETTNVSGAITNLTEHVSEIINELSRSIAPNPHMSVYNSDILSAANMEFENYTTEVNRLTNLISIAQMKYAEALKQEHVDCPKCKHSFNPCKDALDGERISAYISKCNEELILAQTKVDDALAIVKENMTWRSEVRRYTQLTKSWPNLNTLWEEFDNTQAPTDAPLTMPNTVSIYLTYLHHYKNKQNLIASIEANQIALAQRAKAIDKNAEKFTGRMDSLKGRIDSHAVEIEVMETLSSVTQKSLDSVIAIKNHVNRFTDIHSQWTELMMTEFKLGVVKILDDEIARLTTTVNELSTLVSRSASQRTIKDYLMVNREELSQSKEAHKLLVDSLSPTQGIVADVLMGFITAFTDQMNQIAHRFWTTPFNILPCKINNSGLDYKFPIQSVSTADITDDVCDGSEGEKELVNFLFMMIVRLYLGYEKYPLFLDEVGARFHESNRAGLYNYIKALMESNYVGQVYVISHFESTYNTLSHAQINVLDNTGVLVTPDANHHFRLG